MKITNNTNLKYDYFSNEYIILNGKVGYYYEDNSSLDKFQIINERDEVIVCSENKEELLDYLIRENADIYIK